MKKQTKQLATIGSVIVIILLLIAVLPSLLNSSSPDGTLSIFTVVSGQELPFCEFAGGRALCVSGLNSDFSALDPSKTRYIVESNEEHGIKYDSEGGVYAITQTKGVVGSGTNPDCTSGIEYRFDRNGYSGFPSGCNVERLSDSGVYKPNNDVYQIIILSHFVPPEGESSVAYHSFTGKIRTVECYDNEDCSIGVCLDDKTCSGTATVPEDEVEDSIEEKASNINWVYWILGGMVLGIIVLSILGIYLWRKK